MIQKSTCPLTCLILSASIELICGFTQEHLGQRQNFQLSKSKFTSCMTLAKVTICTLIIQA